MNSCYNGRYNQRPLRVVREGLRNMKQTSGYKHFDFNKCFGMDYGVRINSPQQLFWFTFVSFIN